MSDNDTPIDQDGGQLVSRLRERRDTPPAVFEPPPDSAVRYAPAWPRDLDWRRYIAALVRNKWLVLLVTLVGTGAAFGATRFLRPIYLAEAMLWIEGTDPRTATRGPIQSSELLRSYNWVDLVKSYAVLEHVTRELRLYLQPAAPEDSAAFATFRAHRAFEPGEYRLEVDATGQRFTLWRGDTLVVDQGAVGEPVDAALGFQWAPPARVLTPGRSLEFDLVHTRDLARELGNRIQTRMLENGSFMRLELRSEDAHRAAAILNAVSSRTVGLATELKGSRVEELRILLGNQLETAERDLRDAETALELFRVRTAALPAQSSGGAASGGSGAPDPLAGRYLELTFERDDLRRDREAIENALARGDDAELPVVLLESIPAVQASAGLAAALEKLAGQRAERRSLALRYTDEHPLIRELDRSTGKLERETIPALANDVAAQLAVREAALDREIATIAAQLGSVPGRTTEEARLQRQVAIAAQLFTTLKERYEAARLAAASIIPDIRILDTARVPQRPVSDPRLRLVLFAFVGCLGAAIFGVLLLDRFDPRLRYPEQVSDGLGLPILGMIPRMEVERGRTGARLSPQAMEAFRSIRLNLAFAYGDAGPLVATITSPGPGDGKSSVALGLAHAFARNGQRTLLVDGDIRRGALHRQLTAARRPGLSDVLAGVAAIDEIVRSTDDARLDLIPAGSRRDDGPESLTAPAMRDLLAHARASYEVILVDSPPLEAGVDALVLAAFTGHLLAVFRAGATHRGAAEAKLEPLARLPVRILGAVLNDVPAASHIYRPYTYAADYGVEAEGTEVPQTGPARLLSG